MERLRRIHRYIVRMFPPAARIPYGVVSFLSVYISVQALTFAQPFRITWRAGLGIATFILFMFLLRVYDELKDWEWDRKLAAMGDRLHQERPSVKGEVRLEDIRILNVWTSVLLFATALPLGFPIPFLVFVGVFVLFWCSSRWYFSKGVQKYYLLAFATHSPLAIVLQGYVIAIAVTDFGRVPSAAWMALLLAAIWCQLASWDTARKIRTPAEETEYQTYSKILGWKIAALLPALFSILSTAGMLVFARRLGLGRIYGGALIASTCVVVGACLLFRFRPTPSRAKLRPYAEFSMAVAVFGLVLALVLRWGIRIGPVGLGPF